MPLVWGCTKSYWSCSCIFCTNHQGWPPWTNVEESSQLTKCKKNHGQEMAWHDPSLLTHGESNKLF